MVTDPPLTCAAGSIWTVGAAHQRDWPVRELVGEHLHMLIDPGAVAAALVGLAAAATPARS